MPHLPAFCTCFVDRRSPFYFRQARRRCQTCSGKCKGEVGGRELGALAARLDTVLMDLPGVGRGGTGF